MFCDFGNFKILYETVFKTTEAADRISKEEETLLYVTVIFWTNQSILNGIPRHLTKCLLVHANVKTTINIGEIFEDWVTKCIIHIALHKLHYLTKGLEKGGFINLQPFTERIWLFYILIRQSKSTAQDYRITNSALFVHLPIRIKDQWSFLDLCIAKTLYFSFVNIYLWRWLYWIQVLKRAWVLRSILIPHMKITSGFDLWST